MKNRFFLTTISALALMVFYPSNANQHISRETTATDLVVGYFAVFYCLIQEGIYTRTEAYKVNAEALKQDGISLEKMVKIMKDPTFYKRTDNVIKEMGGCREIGKEFENKRTLKRMR